MKMEGLRDMKKEQMIPSDSKEAPRWTEDMGRVDASLDIRVHIEEIVPIVDRTLSVTYRELETKRPGTFRSTRNVAHKALRNLTGFDRDTSIWTARSKASAYVRLCPRAGLWDLKKTSKYTSYQFTSVHNMLEIVSEQIALLGFIGPPKIGTSNLGHLFFWPNSTTLRTVDGGVIARGIGFYSGMPLYLSPILSVCGMVMDENTPITMIPYRKTLTMKSWLGSTPHGFQDAVAEKVKNIREDLNILQNKDCTYGQDLHMFRGARKRGIRKTLDMIDYVGMGTRLPCRYWWENDIRKAIGSALCELKKAKKSCEIPVTMEFNCEQKEI